MTRPDGWIEKHDFPDASTIAEATQLGEAMVARFNESLRPGECARRLVEVTLTEPEPDPYREAFEAAQFSDCPEGCCPACWTRDREEVQMEYSERHDQDVCPNYGYI